MLQTLNFNVADVEIRCLHTCDVGICVEGRGGELLMLDVAHNTGRNIVVT
jgi:hypothetical protein